MSKLAPLSLVLVSLLSACGKGGSGGGGGNHTLTVTAVGAGTITSSPQGINCHASTCSATFAAGSSITLTALPDQGASFSGWSGGPCSGAATCPLTLSGDLQLTGTFQGSGAVTHQLAVAVSGLGTVTSSPQGINCPGAACAASFPNNTAVTLTAAPSVGQTFTGWSGACSGTALCNVTMSADQNVTATFSGTTVTHTLSVTVTGTGSVSSTPAGLTCSGGTCTHAFDAGTQVTLAPSGGTFSNWSGACSGSGNCVVTLSADQSVTAAFGSGSSGYVLTVVLGGDGSGTLTSTPPGINCVSGSSSGCSHDFGSSSGSVALTATAAAGSTYAGQGNNGNIGCNGLGFATTCSYGLNNNGVTVNAWFSAWQGHLYFPATVIGLALAGSTLLAVGSGAAAVTSSDGAAWTGHLAPARSANAVAVLGSTFYAAADGGAVLSTGDGATWTTTSTGVAADLKGIASGAGTLVAVGAGGAIEYSADGTTWHAATSGVSTDLLAVVYANSQFVAVGLGGVILTSANGSAWQARTSNVTNILSAATYGSSTYVAVGTAGTVLTSPDAITWTKQTAFTASALNGVASSGTLFVAAGDAQSGNTTLAFTSPDGVTWTARGTNLFEEPFAAAAFQSGNFYAMGKSGSIVRSADGISWSVSLSPGGRSPPGQGSSIALQSVAYNGTTYAAVGDWQTIFSSTDGNAWTLRHAGFCCGGLTSVVWGAGLANPVFVAVGWTNPGWVVFSSPDGTTWTQRASGSSGYVVNLAYGGAAKGFAVVGAVSSGNTYSGIAQTSPDGITWTASASAATGITSSISGLTYGNGLFVATGGAVSNLSLAGTIFTSPDGATWTQQSAPTGAGGLGPALFGNGVLLALDSQNKAVATSTDGVHWSRQTYAFGFGAGLAFGNGQFFNSALSTSTDGVTWTTPPPLPDLPLYNGGIFLGATYAQGRWLGVGAYESILTHP